MPPRVIRKPSITRCHVAPQLSADCDGAGSMPGNSGCVRCAVVAIFVTFDADMLSLQALSYHIRMERHKTLNSRQRKTLDAIFSGTGTVRFPDIESLLLHIGCEVFEGAGSAVTFRLAPHKVHFHRPHPGNEAKAYQVRDARSFLAAVGVTPESVKG